jgi:hypothetical protein
MKMSRIILNVILAASFFCNQNVFAQSSITSAPSSDYLLDQYVAYVGPQDLFNSSGQRLTKPWQIVRQDRANFHLFGRGDRLDGPDAFFGLAENRERLEYMLRSGHISQQAARDIVVGGVLVHVQIYGRGTTGRSVHISVAR